MVHQNGLEKNQATEKEATNEKLKLKVLSNFNYQSLGHYPAASQVLYPTHAEEAVQADEIANGYFSQQPSIGQSVLNVPLYYNGTQQQVSNNFFLKWVNVTTVSKCYGCNGRIPNAPTTPLENLIIARLGKTLGTTTTEPPVNCSAQVSRKICIFILVIFMCRCQVANIFRI